jgi:hypothetical protein
LLTFTKEFFDANPTAVLATLTSDSHFNCDGFGIVTLGERDTDATVTKAKSLAGIETVLYYGEWKRCFIHCRASTTSNETVGDCHPFEAYDQDGKCWWVMHNGILSGYGSDNYRVDSQLIADIISRYGIQAALGHLWEHQSFANVMIVNPESGDWYVHRSTGGQLHTDGKGNYSTHICGPITQAVKDSYCKRHYDAVEIAKPVTGQYRSYTEWLENKHMEAAKALGQSTAVPGPEAAATILPTHSSLYDDEGFSLDDFTEREWSNLSNAELDSIIDRHSGWDDKDALDPEFSRTQRAIASMVKETVSPKLTKKERRALRKLKAQA